MAVRKQYEMVGRKLDLPILRRFEILNKIRLLDNLRDQALISFLYLTAARISEVVPFIKEKSKTQLERVVVSGGIKRGQIEFVDSTIYITEVRSLKRKTAGHSNRTIPIVINEIEQPFIEILQSYLKTLDENDELFPITRQRSSQILEKVGLFNHYLRHLRLSHLSVDYNLSAAELQKYVNWATSFTSDYYVRLNVSDLVNKMKRR